MYLRAVELEVRKAARSTRRRSCLESGRTTSRRGQHWRTRRERELRAQTSRCAWCSAARAGGGSGEERGAGGRGRRERERSGKRPCQIVGHLAGSPFPGVSALPCPWERGTRARASRRDARACRERRSGARCSEVVRTCARRAGTASPARRRAEPHSTGGARGEQRANSPARGLALVARASRSRFRTVPKISDPRSAGQRASRRSFGKCERVQRGRGARRRRLCCTFLRCAGPLARKLTSCGTRRVGSGRTSRCTSAVRLEIFVTRGAGRERGCRARPERRRATSLLAPSCDRIKR